MLVVAHLAGVPLEEMLLLACGGGALWASVRAWTSAAAARTGRSARRLRGQDRRVP